MPVAEPPPAAAAAAADAGQAAGHARKTLEAPKPATEPAPAVAADGDALKAAADAAAQAASSAVSDAQKTIESPKAAGERTPPTDAAAAAQAAKAAVPQTTAAPAAATNQAQALIDKAKGLVTNEKYQDALNVVQQLSSLKLTPEQQTLVDGLKSQIQTALAKVTATDAASALGNVLGGKK